jgi:hypothetical protein
MAFRASNACAQVMMDSASSTEQKTPCVEIRSYKPIYGKAAAALVSTEVDSSGGPRVHQTDSKVIEASVGSLMSSSCTMLTVPLTLYRAARMDEADEDPAATRKQEGQS